MDDLFNSPSFVSFSDDSIASNESSGVYKRTMRIPKIPRPYVKKKLFRRPSNLPPRQTLKEYLVQIGDPFVTSTPLTDSHMINSNLLLQLTPINKKRNSIISSNFLSNKKPVSQDKMSRNIKTRKSVRSKKESCSFKKSTMENNSGSVELLYEITKEPTELIETNILAELGGEHSSKLATMNIKVHTNDTNLEKINIANSLPHSSYYSGGRLLRSASRINNNNTLITDNVDFKLKKPTRTKIKNCDLSANENKRKVSEENRSNHTLENKIKVVDTHNKKKKKEPQFNLSIRSSSRRKAAVNEVNKSINIESIAEEDSNDAKYVGSVVDNSNTVPKMLEESKAGKISHCRANVKTKMHNKSEHIELDKNIFDSKFTTKQKSHSKNRTTKMSKTTSVNIHPNDVSIILQQYIINRGSDIVEIQKEQHLGADSPQSFRGDGRLRRNKKTSKAFIQATYVGATDLKKKLSTTSSTMRTKNACVSDVQKTESTLVDENDFKKPKGRAKKSVKAAQRILNFDTVDAIENTVNSEESQNTNCVASISNILIHQHVLVPPLNSTSDKSETSNNNLKKLDVGDCSGSEEKKKGNSKRYISSVVNDKVIPLDWYSEEPNLDDPDNFKVLYSLTNIKFHKGKISTGYITFGPDQGKSEIALNHVIIFKIEKGSALVSQQLVSAVMNVDMSFYIPLGVAYKIKNLSDSLPLVLYFMKVSGI
ncbi:hypothetical protein FQA39_LY11908 [Lamprigera yunnana]|nr:hypothetical protein FQA39_LY11908 [Lamprigera yunnana]